MVKRLINSISYALPNELNAILDSYNFVFNPSFLKHDSFNYLTIRVYDDLTNSILSFLYIWNGKKVVNKINLSEYFSLKLDIKKVADPKLFIMGNSVYGTYNTGDRMKDSNQIILFKLDKNQISNFYICKYSERTRIEKNWAFFNINNELHVLYSLSPLTILKTTNVIDNNIVFKKKFSDENQNFKNYSIGTQLLELNDKYYFIAHKKIFFRKRRLYLGRLFELTKGAHPKATAKPLMLIHSLKSLLGEKFKFNKKLISCTYFSGISKYKDKIILSYGINDLKWKLAIIKFEKRWL
ncbi:MAG: hypothetical protein KDC67_15185 [Ignavibacteriae bacterium]|nr:hypothetical protein [Ignavibacteriota bacterium]